MYQLPDFSVDEYPPLEDFLGSITINTDAQILLYKKIKRIQTEEPLAVIFTDQDQKVGTLFGEHSWKWRMQNHLESNSFKDFDTFLNKLVFYIASNQQKKRLNVHYEPFYYSNDAIAITAEYFDNNYIFNPNATIQITLKNKENSQEITFPFLLKNNFYEVNLSGLAPGNYSFIVTVNEQNITSQGSFTILEFNVEQQFQTAAITKLTALANTSQGSVYMPNQEAELIQKLMQDTRFTPTQKNHEKVVSLIDWKYVLPILILAFTVEWFLRKYNGLI